MLHQYIGCSGFSYKEWKSVFYPEGLAQRKWFDYYCEHFNTLELNVTFYRFPQVTTLQKWFEKSPDDFIFSVKAPRLITHYKKFEDTERLLDDFYTTIKKGLQKKLGAVLFQLPASVHFSAEKLSAITNQLNPSFQNVIEFRHESWWQQEVYDELAKHHICFCSISHPALPDKIISNTSVIYIRFHGVPKLYQSNYVKEYLHHIMLHIKKNKKINTAYYYFNNTAAGHAVTNALQLQSFQ